MKCLVIGFGSIGRRHARVLGEIGFEVAVVTSATDTSLPAFRDLRSALDEFAPGYVVIANDTRLHGPTLAVLASHGLYGTTLVEKPMLAGSGEARVLPSGPVFVGYTLRFHPLITRLMEQLDGQALWTFTAYVGQYLPDWRPDRDYRQSYSARREDGGVVRDLSHELDYAQLLAGRWCSTIAAGGKLSTLDIDSEDAVTVLARCERCELVTVHMNYLDRSVSRWILVNGPFGTLKADLVKGTLAINGDEQQVVVERDAMMRQQHLAAMSGADPRACDAATALSTVRWVDAIHQSLADGCRVDADPHIA